MSSVDSKHDRFMRLFLRDEPEMLRTALIYIPARNEAREILQETAVALWRDFDLYDPNRPFAAWACGYVRIQVHRYLRESHKRTLLSERAADVIAAAESLITKDSERRRHALLGCLQFLGSKQQQLIHGYYFEERSVEELSLEQHCTIDSIYKSLQRIRRNLLECIEGKLTRA